MINNREYHNLKYVLSFDTLNCNSIEYIANHCVENSYGLIIHFFNLNCKLYILIKKLIKNSIKVRGLNAVCMRHSDKLTHNTMHHTSDFELIEFKYLTRRCIIIEYFYENKIEVHLSPCMELNEHD